MGFLLSLNLPVGFAPLDPPARISSSAHLSTLADKKQQQTFTGCLAAFLSLRYGLCPCTLPKRLCPFGFPANEILLYGGLYHEKN